MIGRIFTNKGVTTAVARRAATARLSSPATLTQGRGSALSSAPVMSTFRFQSTEPAFVPTEERKYKYFQNVEVTPEGVAVVRFDCPKAVNSISFDLSREAQEMWRADVANNSAIKAVVFSSGKKDMFIAGADIFDLQAIENKQDLVGLIADGMDFFQEMKKKGVPLVSAIDGPALGGGLEWAMWCDYRVCSDSDKTKLGLPEVKLGLLPGFGGTQNLHQLVGLQTAMDMMLTGKEVRPDKAKKMGLVDAVVSPSIVESVAIKSASELASGKLKPKRKPKSWTNKFLEDTSLGRRIIWDQVKKMVDKNTKGKYPSPYAIMQCVQHGLDNPSTKYKNEREQFAKLAATPESAALIGIFDGMTQMKKHNYGSDAANPVNTVAVLGAGLMGAGIAQVSAEKGFNVLLKDRNDEAVERGQKYMRDNWDKKLKRKRMTNFKYNLTNSNVVGLTDDSPSWKQHFGNTELVIEAVFEDLDLKKKIVADMEAVLSEDSVFATNTSAIPISSIAEGAKRPENIVGMHYFSPVPSMPLLEIIPHEGTSDAAIATAFEVGTKQGKTCVVVKDVPGFYVNRCLGPMLSEVSAVIKDGAPLDKIDKAMLNFGMPVGPITLADEVGIDVSTHVSTFLSEADLGVRMEGGDVSMMQKMMDKGWLGKKTGKGFFVHEKKGKKTPNPGVDALLKEFVTRDLKLDEKEIQDRLVAKLVNEAAKCLEDGIIENPVVGDIGMVFGIGFAPFRGGPFRYLDQVGVSQYVDMMNGLADKYGPQFEPCQLLKDYAATDKKFHKL